MQEIHTQYLQKVNVWAGIIDGRILGPFFFANNLTRDRYLQFLQLELMLALFPTANNPDLPNNTIWLQQDGAPPYYAINVRHYLDQVLSGRLIGRRGSMEWPTRSPDLTPLNRLFLWGCLKSKVYNNRPNNLEDLKAKKST
jgi:hypothetical protein